MLEKVVCIDNIGVIKKGVPKALDLEKVTLIYADNARGKSTLAALMTACAAGDAADMVKSKTVGAMVDQKVILRFKAPQGDFNAQFDGKAWSGDSPNLHVFNQAFVERNVYTGAAVSPEQRASLLELALGNAAVAQRAEYQKHSEAQRACAGRVTAAEGALAGFRSTLSVDQFIALPQIADVDAKIQNLDQQISGAQGVAQTLAKPLFKKLVAPVFNLDEFRALAASELAQVQDGVEALVKKHFAEHQGEATERWVADGLLHKPEPNCPFCGQQTQGLELLEAYKVYFNQAYKNHLTKIATMKSLGSRSVPLTALADWAGILAFNEGAAGNWVDTIKFTLPAIDVDAQQSVIAAISTALEVAAGQKMASPLEAVDLAPLDMVLEWLIAVTTEVDRFNAAIDVINQVIEDHKQSLVGVDLNAVVVERAAVLLHKTRHDLKVKPLVEAVTTARTDYKAAETAKDAAKVQLDKLMEQVLSNFQGEINNWLVKFGAPFRLKELEPTYRGGGLRSQYVIEVRGVEVPVGPAPAGVLNFHSALSEGDKRTLAFAFFLAKLFADPSREHAVVVLDDVFTSLDHHRRHNTVEAAVRVAHECAQVIALGHDAHFLRELRKRAEKKKVGNTLELCLHRDADGYSQLTDFELDTFCASDYYKHYVLVEQFIAGALAPGQHLDVAKALRVLVEGHLHRCFPRYFKEGVTVGVALETVKNATSGSPLVALHPLFTDLANFNEYAAAYHHDTSGGYPRTDINDSELQHFAKGAIGFIQARKLW